MKILILICLVALVAVKSFADEPTYGSPAPGKWSCQMTYWAKDPSIQISPPPPGCYTCFPGSNGVLISPDEFKKPAGMTYLSMGAKEAYVDLTDGQLELVASAQINADGYTNGEVIIRQNGKEIGRATGPVVVQSRGLQLRLPVAGVVSKNLNVDQIEAICSYENN